MPICPDLPKFFRLRIRAWDFITACGAVLSFSTLAGFLGRYWWFLDLFSHFRVQYLFGLTIVTLLPLFHRAYSQSTFFGLFALINLFTIVPLYIGKEPNAAAQASRSYRSLLMNVNTETGKPDQVAKAIQLVAPDVVVLEEVNDQWLSLIAGALQAYPYAKVMPREDNFGIAPYSKFPFAQAEIRQVGEADLPSIIAELNLTSRRLTVIATHPLPPGNAENARLRDNQLAGIAEVVKQSDSPVLVLGDLNATAWSFSFNQLLNRSGLRDASQGHGVLPTWPTFFPIMLIPIDHCLYTAGIHATREFLGPKTGSDHYPVVLDFVVTSAATKHH